MSAEIIQANFESLDNIANQFQQQAEAMAQMQQQVQIRLATLRDGGWEGKGSAAFFAEMDHTTLPATERLVTALEEASRTLYLIQNILRTAEEEAAAPFRTGTPPSIIQEGKSVRDNFDGPELLFQANRLFLDIIQGLVQNRTATRSALRELGRLLNALTEQRGHVGLIDDIYKFLIADGIPYRGSIDKLLKSGWFKGGLVAADALFGLFNDLNQGTYGDDYLKAGGVNTIDALIQFGIASNPIGAVTLITNSALQVGGTLQVGVQRTLADLFAVDTEMGSLLQQDANAVASAVEKANLGNVTKEIGEGIYTNISNRLSAMADSAQLGMQGIKDLWQNPSWQTLQSVAEKQWAFNKVHQADLLSSVLGPASFLLIPTSTDGWREYGEAALAAANVVDGLADWSVATGTSMSNQSVNAVTQIVNHMPFVPDSMKNAVTEGAKDLVAFQQRQRDWVIGLIDINGDL